MSDQRSTHFGVQTVDEADKAARVAGVFHSVAGRYDLMNDLMSAGLHRVWKAFTVAQAAVRPGMRVLDLAGGTGDLARAFARRVGPTGEVWLTDMSWRLKRWDEVPPEERILILKTVHQEATRAGLAPELVLSVIHVESNFDRFAISSAGARGLMQVMPFWLDELDRPDDDLFDIRTNIRFGCTILKHYLDREKGNHSRALARYNGSLGQLWYPQRVFDAMRKRWYLQ